MNKSKPIYLFFDMDGVLAEYRIYCGINEMKKERYFASLKPEWNMLEVIEIFSKRVLEGKCEIKPYILTKVYPTTFTYSVEEKEEWRNRFLSTFNHLPAEHYILVDGEKEEKSEAIKRQLGIDINLNCILIDDYNSNLIDWKNNGGTSVKYVNGVNDKNKSFIGKRLFYYQNPATLVSEIEKIVTEIRNGTINTDKNNYNNKNISNNPMYCLVSVCDREIEHTFFSSEYDAFVQMRKEFEEGLKYCGLEEFHFYLCNINAFNDESLYHVFKNLDNNCIEFDCCKISNTEAWLNAKNHYDWKIFKIGDETNE